MKCPRCGSLHIGRTQAAAITDKKSDDRECHECGFVADQSKFADDRQEIVKKADKATAALRGQRPLNAAEIFHLESSLVAGLSRAMQEGIGTFDEWAQRQILKPAPLPNDLSGDELIPMGIQTVTPRKAKAMSDEKPMVTPEEFWPILLQDDDLGHAVRNLLSLLTLVDKRRLQGASIAAKQNIERTTTLGPILDPSAWLAGERFDNARDTKAVLDALVTLRNLLPDAPYHTRVVCDRCGANSKATADES